MLLSPDFEIPKDYQGSESDAKAKEPLFELARAQSPHSPTQQRDVEKESEFQKAKQFYRGLGNSWWGDARGLYWLATGRLRSWRDVLLHIFFFSNSN